MIKVLKKPQKKDEMIYRVCERCKGLYKELPYVLLSHAIMKKQNLCPECQTSLDNKNKNGKLST